MYHTTMGDLTFGLVLKTIGYYIVIVILLIGLFLGGMMVFMGVAFGLAAYQQRKQNMTMPRGHTPYMY